MSRHGAELLRDDEHRCRLVSSTMYSSFVMYNRSMKVRRLVFDEADSIKIPSCSPMNAQFTWLVTSSLENIMFPNGYYYVRLEDTYRHVRRVNVAGVRRLGYINDICKSSVWDRHVGVVEASVEERF